MMIGIRPRQAALAVGLLVVGCASSATPKPATTVAATSSTELHSAELRGDLGTFTPWIAATEDGGECRRVPFDGRDGATALVLLRFPDAAHPKRNVSVAIDSAGRLLHYSDVRGALKRGDVGPQTFVLIDFVRGTAQAGNRAGDGSEEISQGSVDEALDDANLGPPQRMLDMLRSRCGLR